MRYHSETEDNSEGFWQKKSFWQDSYTGLFFVVSSIKNDYADETMIFLGEAEGSSIKICSYQELDVKPSDVCHKTLMESWNPDWQQVCAVLRGMA